MPGGEPEVSEVAEQEWRFHATEAEIAAAFTEWDRRYREDPRAFENEAARLLRGTPESYGESCAPYFISILLEQNADLQEIHPPSIPQ